LLNNHHLTRAKQLKILVTGLIAALSCSHSCSPAQAQAALPAIQAPAAFPTLQLAQQPVLPSLIPTDVTPIGLGRERELLKPGPTFYLLQKLPSRLWINGSVELSNRGETNVFFTRKHHKADYVFRTLPNLTIGYRILPRTSVYTNYFVLKDVFAAHGVLTYPTTQSVSMGLRHEIPIRTRTNLQFDLQAREIWQARNLHQFDFLPGVTLTHVLTPRTIIFGNIQLQLRGKRYFQAPTREIDPFYTIGWLHRRGPWTFTAVDTFVLNYRNNNAVPPQTNLSMISQFEAARQVSKKVPGLVAFARAEPIWNWQSRSYPGISGFDFRIYGGLRYSFNKAATNTAMDLLRRQLQDSQPVPPQPQRTPRITPPVPTTEEPVKAAPLVTEKLETEPATAPTLVEDKTLPDNDLKTETLKVSETETAVASKSQPVQ